MPKRITGRVLYTSDKTGREGAERGREFFTISILPNGARTLEAHCEIDDEPSVLRHVTLSMDGDWRVLDAFVRIVVNDRFVGSSWFRFTPTLAACEGFTVNEGRISQHIPIETPLDGFGVHPIQADAILCRAYPLRKGIGSHPFNLMLCSAHHRGATGPMLVPVKHDVRYAGTERITVSAGEFDSHHFIFGQDDNWAADDPLKHPLYHLWCTADGNYIVLRAKATGYMQTSYELTSLEITA